LSAISLKDCDLPGKSLLNPRLMAYYIQGLFCFIHSRKNMSFHRSALLLATSTFLLMQAPVFAQSTKPLVEDAVVVAEKYSLMEGVVTKVDARTRTVVLKNDQGETQFVAPKSVKNFAQIKVGDQLNITFEIGVAVELLNSKGNIRSEKQTTTVSSANSGEKPAGSVANTTTVITDVMEIDKAKRNISVKGMDGEIHVVHVKNKKLFNQIELHDQIKVIYFDEMKAVVSAPKK